MATVEEALAAVHAEIAVEKRAAHTLLDEYAGHIAAVQRLCTAVGVAAQAHDWGALDSATAKLGREWDQADAALRKAHDIERTITGKYIALRVFREAIDDSDGDDRK